MKQSALRLCSSLSGQDFAQLALVQSWAGSIPLTPREEGRGAVVPRNPGKRGDDTERRRDLPHTRKAQHGRGRLSSTAPWSNLVDAQRAGSRWNHPTEVVGQANTWRPWRGRSFPSEEISKCHYKAQKGALYNTAIICLLHFIENNVIGQDSIRTQEKTIMPPNQDMVLIGLKSQGTAVGYPIFLRVK